MGASISPAWLEVNLAQFRSNLRAIRRRIGRSLLCVPVKANAYGHGLVPMAVAAADAGVDALAVSCLAEGKELRSANIGCPIIVFGAIHEEQIDDLLDCNLEFSISSQLKAELVAKKCRGRKCRVHLEVDTGMCRTGVRPETALRLFHEMLNYGCFEIVGIYSHLATADSPGDPFAIAQIARFKELQSHINDDKILWHLANSGGVAHYPEAYLDMVRPGLLAYGLSSPDVSPLLTLKAKISYFKVVPANQGISYGHLYRTRTQTRIVTIPVGYGDGYPRDLSNRSEVLIRGKRYPVVGAICMDQLMVDIGLDEAFVGEEVVLIGRQGTEEIAIWDLAKQLNTDPRDLFCRFHARLPRVYI